MLLGICVKCLVGKCLIRIKDIVQTYGCIGSIDQMSEQVFEEFSFQTLLSLPSRETRFIRVG